MFGTGKRNESVRVLDVGFVPEAAVSGAILLQDEHSTFLIFNAMKPVVGSDQYEGAGLAVCEFLGCKITKFGYPNDEAWYAIPRTKGLSYDICEVENSEWKREIATLNRYAFPQTPDITSRHLLILFHDSSFECIADEMRVEFTDEPLERVLTRLSNNLGVE